MKNLLEGAASLLFPPRCGLCGRSLDRGAAGILCQECMADLHLLHGPACPVCGRPAASGQRCGACLNARVSYERFRPAGLYEGRLKDCILAFKYEGRRSLVRLLGGLLSEVVAASPDEWQFDCIVPVPLDRKREHERGFNQAAELARELGRLLSRRVLEGGLRRVRQVPPQTRLGREEREKNVAGVFEAARRRELAGKRVLLVDDVFTSGATVRECATALSKAGVVGVLVLTVARTPGTAR